MKYIFTLSLFTIIITNLNAQPFIEVSSGYAFHTDLGKSKYNISHKTGGVYLENNITEDYKTISGGRRF